MNICTNKIAALGKNLNPKLKQWLWFVGLWFFGLVSVLALSTPIKLLVKSCQ